MSNLKRVELIVFEQGLCVVEGLVNTALNDNDR